MDNENNNNVQKTGSNGLAITGMVLGIISILLCWVPILGLVLAIVGLILGIKGLKAANELNGKGKGMGIAGISCGSVGTVLSVIYLIVWIFTVLLVKEVYDEAKDELDSYKKLYNTTSYNSYYDYDIDF